MCHQSPKIPSKIPRKDKKNLENESRILKNPARNLEKQHKDPKTAIERAVKCVQETRKIPKDPKNEPEASKDRLKKHQNSLQNRE